MSGDRFPETAKSSMAEPRMEKRAGLRISVSPEEVMDFLGSIPLLQQLPGTLLEKIVDVVEPLQFEKGELLLREGTTEDGLYFLWRGKAEVSLPSSGDEVSRIMGTLKSGDYFGYANAGPIKTLNKADITAVTEVTCFVLRNENAHLLCSVSIWAQQPEDGEVALLERILQVEALEVDLYRGYTEDYPSFYGNVYGGQLLGQALAAASKSVDPALLVHSLHAYFLLTGDDRMPIIYKVDRTRNGHTFATRQVSAIQKGRVIFVMYASFQRAGLEGFEHQESMPNVPMPDLLLSKEEIRKRYFSDPRIPLEERERLAGRKSTKTIPLEIKEVDPADEVSNEALPPRQSVWLKSKGKLTDEPALHRCAAVYMSDWTFLDTARRPHRNLPLQLLSLDHSMWFHKPFRADEWLLSVQSSPRAGHGRASVYGHFFNQNGELVMSASQEGLMRIFQKPDRLTAKSKL